MLDRLNPLKHPIALAEPRRLTPYSAWHEHIPFAMMLMDIARPQTFVELGTHAGDSYCAFCQSVAALELSTKCFAVDTWAGDEHSKSYGSHILDDLRAHQDPLYADFSELIRSTFEDARERFSDGSIDLLHIDGFHTYDAVRHDFETWLPTLSDRGIVLFHDTAVTEFGFGVKTFWDEVRTRYPSFEFVHGFGLGVLATGEIQTDEMRDLTGASPEETHAIRDLFSSLGQRLSRQVEIGRMQQSATEIRRSIGWRILRRLDRLHVRLIPPES